MAAGFLPSTDAALLAWSNNFSTLISAGAVSFGLTVGQGVAYAALNAAYSVAITAVDPGVRSKAAVQTKNSARLALKNSARMLARIVEATPGVTNTQKTMLGLTVRSTPTPIPVPATQPRLIVKSVIGRTVTVMLRGPDVTRRGKPAGIASAFIYSFIGNAPPATFAAYTFEGSSTRTTFVLQFPPTVIGGAQVWLTACWANPRDQTGPACTPVTAYLQGGSVSLAA